MKLIHSIKRIVLAILAIPFIFFSFCVPVWGYGAFLGLNFNERISPPGEMVDIGTHRLHLNCSGERHPTVILEAGSADWSGSWTGVKNLLPDDLRVCSYDRAGMGWSDKGPNPRNAEIIASELTLLLDFAEEKSPWIFVGHSFGGTIGLTFIEKNSERMAGYVAVETPTYTFMKYRDDTRFILRGTGRRLLGPYASVTGSAMSILFSQDVNTQAGAIYTEQELAAIKDPGFKTKMASMITREDPYIEDLRPSMKEKSFPVAVVQGAASHLASTQWNDNQLELLTLSTNSRLFTAHNAHHGVPRMAPEVIVDALEWVLDSNSRVDSRNAY